MGRIYFHTQTETVQISGAERAHAGIVTDALGYSVLEAVCDKQHLAALVDMGPADRHLSLAIRNAERPLLVHDGVPITAWPLLLNTALAVGSDAMKFLTRLHAQCEIHGWIAGEDRDWLAEIIGDGLDTGILRREMGWESLLDMLPRSYKQPVVMSYSTEPSFPNHQHSTWESSPDIGIDEAEEQWAELSTEDQWEYGMDWLGRNQDRLLQLSPQNWSEVRLGHGLTAFDMEKILRGRKNR